MESKENVTSQELKGECFQKEGGVYWSDAIEDSRGWKCQRVCMRLRKLEVTGGLSKAISLVSWSCVGEGNLLGEHDGKGNKYRDRAVVRGGCGVNEVLILMSSAPISLQLNPNHPSQLNSSPTILVKPLHFFITQSPPTSYSAWHIPPPAVNNTVWASPPGPLCFDPCERSP